MILMSIRIIALVFTIEGITFIYGIFFTVCCLFMINFVTFLIIDSFNLDNIDDRLGGHWSDSDADGE